MEALGGRGGEAPAAELGWGMSQAISGHVRESCVRTSALFSWLSAASPGIPGLASGLRGCRRSRK